MDKDKNLLLKYLCMSLPYGVKILHTGWDCDSGTDFDTVETLIGIDDKFIYTVWDKTGDREKHCLSVSNWKPYLRPMSSMTEEEYDDMFHQLYLGQEEFFRNCSNADTIGKIIANDMVRYDWLNKKMFDYRGLIPKGLALVAPEGMYN